VPKISEFYGVVIRMHHGDHGPPHFHAEWEGRAAVFTLDGRILRGLLSVRATRLVKEWALARQRELHENWLRAASHARLVKIRPLE